MSFSYSSFAFNNSGRLGNDDSFRDITSVQNAQSCSYVMQNYAGGCGTPQQAVGFALSQPMVNYTGAGLPPSKVDAESKLLISTLQTHPKGHLILHPRMYATVPYLGRGPCPDAMVELEMQAGSQYTNRRSVNQLAERNYDGYRRRHLLPEQEETQRGTYVSNAGRGWAELHGVSVRSEHRDRIAPSGF